MKFTKEIPTKPGLYAWRAIEDESCEVDAFAVIDINGELHYRSFDDCNPVSELGGEWCRLVPADEIEKAWRESEGYPLDLTGVSGLENSRAKRVMEGGE